MYRWTFARSGRGSLWGLCKSNLHPHHMATNVCPMEMT